MVTYCVTKMAAGNSYLICIRATYFGIGNRYSESGIKNPQIKENRCFRNFYSSIPVDVVRVKSYVNRLFDPAGGPMMITTNKFKLYFVPKQAVSGIVSVFSNREVWVRASRMSRSCSLILSRRGLPVSLTLLHSQGIL